MNSQRLTNGALLRYLRGTTSEKAILQVVGIKTIESKADDPSTSSTNNKRYRLMLSDGKHTFSSCMLGTQMNRLIEMNLLKENSIVRIDRVMVNSIDKLSGRVMLMLYELEVIQNDCERIGEPISLPLSDIIENDTNENRHDINNNNHVPMLSTFLSETKNTNINRLICKTSSKIDDRTALIHNADLSLKETNGINKDRIIYINTLNPYMNKWTIKVRVSNKSQIRTYENARGTGKLFSCDLVDQTGEIRATAFNSECDKFYHVLEIDEVYYITKVSLRSANRQFNSINNDYEMTFNHDTIVEPCPVAENQMIPRLQFNFISIGDIQNRLANSICDVIGVVKSVSDIQIIVGKISQKEYHKRDILLIDEHASVSVTLWGQQAEQFNGSSYPILAFKGIKITDFNNRTLSCINSTLIRQNPSETQRTNELRTWFDREGKSLNLPELSKGIDPINRPVIIKTFSQITSEGLGFGDKPVYISVKGMCTNIKRDTAVYMMCPEEKCGKKVIDENDGMYRCEKCNKTYDKFKWAYMIAAEISDTTGAQWITIFRSEAEIFLGVTANEFGNHKLHQNDCIIEDIIRKVMNRERIFKLRVKAERYNDERRVRFTCLNITDIDWPLHIRRLIDEIKSIKQ